VGISLLPRVLGGHYAPHCSFYSMVGEHYSPHCSQSSMPGGCMRLMVASLACQEGVCASYLPLPYQEEYMRLIPPSTIPRVVYAPHALFLPYPGWYMRLMLSSQHTRVVYAPHALLPLPGWYMRLMLSSLLTRVVYAPHALPLIYPGGICASCSPPPIYPGGICASCSPLPIPGWYMRLMLSLPYTRVNTLRHLRGITGYIPTLRYLRGIPWYIPP